MKRILLLALLLTTRADADYESWFGMTPFFAYPSEGPNATSLSVEWASEADWPDRVPRHFRLSHPLSAEKRALIVASFGQGPWSVHHEADDRKGYVAFTRRVGEEVTGTEPAGPGTPSLLQPAERVARAKELLANLGYPVETLVPRRRQLWSESEGPVGGEREVVAGVILHATIGGFRLLPKSASAVSVGIDRYGRTTELRLVWRRTREDGEFKIATKEAAEQAILDGKARTYDFGFSRQMGAPTSPEDAREYSELKAAVDERSRDRLPPLPIERKVIVKGAEIVLLDYASEEGWFGDEKPIFGRFDEVFWPMFILEVDVVTAGTTRSGLLMLPADAAWFREAETASGLRLGPPARNRR
jgi:hypothetical protein